MWQKESMRISRWAPSWVAVVATVASARAFGAGPDVSPRAQALFDEGQRLVAAGKVREACPKFLASHGLDPGVGVLLNLADCYERAGMLASAWARFRDVAGMARRAGQPEREAYAQKHIAELEPRLAWLKVDVDARIDGETFTVDGVATPAEVLDTRVPVDPGEHTVAAAAPGKAAVSLRVDVKEEGRVYRVSIPALTSVGPSGPGPRTPEPSPSRGSTGASRWIGAGVLGLSAAAAGLGVVFGAQAIDKQADYASHCRGAACDAYGVRVHDDAATAADLSTVTFCIAGVLAVTGVVLLVTSGSKASAPRTVGLTW